MKSIVFAALMVAIPWPAIWEFFQGREMADRRNYISAIEGRLLRVDYIEYQSLWEMMRDEYLWGLALSWMRDSLHMPAEAILSVFSFFVLAVLSVVVVRELPWVYLILLVNPLVIGLVFSQTRSAVAVALLFLALLARRRARLLMIGLVVAALGVHTAVPLFLLLYLGSNIRKSRENSNASLSWLKPVATGVVVGLAIGPLFVAVLDWIGDRRGGYSHLDASRLDLYFFLVFLLIALVNWPALRGNPMARTAIALFSMASVSFLFGGYSTRFIASLFPLIIITAAILFRHERRDLVMSGLLVLYILARWTVWLGVF